MCPCDPWETCSLPGPWPPGGIDSHGDPSALPPYPAGWPLALESKCRSGEKKVDALQKEKRRLEVELEAVSRKTHDASGQLVLISQELLRKER